MFGICWCSSSWFIMTGFYFTFHIITMPLLSVKGFCVPPGFLEYHHKHSYTNHHLFSMYRRDWQWEEAVRHLSSRALLLLNLIITYPGVPYSTRDGLAHYAIGSGTVTVHMNCRDRLSLSVRLRGSVITDASSGGRVSVGACATGQPSS